MIKEPLKTSDYVSKRLLPLLLNYNQKVPLSTRTAPVEYTFLVKLLNSFTLSINHRTTDLINTIRDIIPPELYPHSMTIIKFERAYFRRSFEFSIYIITALL